MINTKLISKFRKKFKSGDVCIGAWMQIPSTDIAEILSKKKFDWIALDLEHGNFNRETLTDIIRVISLSNIIPLVRVSNSSTEEIKNALDSGAYGVILPMIKSINQLKSIVNICKWPPNGERGVAYFRGNSWGAKFNEYKSFAKKPIIIPMVETKEFASDLKKIDNSLIDAIFIGPYDLSASLGVFGKFNSTTYKNSLKSIVKTCKNLSIPSGIHIVQPSNKDLKNTIKIGFQFIAYSLDTVILDKYYSFD